MSILMDIMMPVMNGYEASKDDPLSGQRGCKVIPIIAMTANAFTEDRIRAKESRDWDEHISMLLWANLLVR